MVEALERAIGDRTVGEERGIALAAGFEQGGLAHDVEEGLLLTGKARVGQVLGGGAGADGDGGQGLARAFAERAVGRKDVIADIGGKVAARDGGADRRAGFVQCDPT